MKKTVFIKCFAALFSVISRREYQFVGDISRRASYAAEETLSEHSSYYYSGGQDACSADEPEEWYVRLEKYAQYDSDRRAFRLTLKAEANNEIMRVNPEAPCVTVLVINTSNNMNTVIRSLGISRMEYVKSAAKAFIDDYYMQGGDRYIAVIGYENYGYMLNGGYFCDNQTDAKGMINSLCANSDGFSNTQEG